MSYGLDDTFEAGWGVAETVSDVDALRRRLDVVEDQVTRLAEEMATTRAMTAMNDRDLAELRLQMRGQTRVLNALRDTQIGHGATLAEHGGTLDHHTSILNQHSRALDDHGRALGTLVAGQAAIMRHLRIPDEDDDENAEG